jgi:hypothetical protein
LAQRWNSEGTQGPSCRAAAHGASSGTCQPLWAVGWGQACWHRWAAQQTGHTVTFATLAPQPLVTMAP